MAMQNREEVADAVDYLCQRGKETYESLTPVKDRTAGPEQCLGFIQGFVHQCIQIAEKKLDVMAIKGAAEKAKQEAAAAAVKEAA